jgi:hypothetical protein
MKRQAQESEILLPKQPDLAGFGIVADRQFAFHYLEQVLTRQRPAPALKDR